MPKIDFSQFYYFPCLQCTEVEQIGYRELSDDDKDAILPIFELGQVKYEAPFEDTISAVAAIVKDRPFLLDLSKDRAPPAFVPKNNPDKAKTDKLQAAQDAYNKFLTWALATGDGFANWRELVSKFPNAIPVLQFTDPETQGKAILRQAAQLLKVGVGQLAIRITQETSEAIYPVIGQIAAVLDSAAQLLLIVDCGQGRQRIAERAEFAKSAIARVLEEVGPAQAVHLSAVCLNDSYTNPQDGTPKLYESSSWELWSQASETFPFLYGDYGAHYRIKKTNTYMPGDWRAQVVYPMDEKWLVYRHPNSQDANGWIEGSKAITADPNYDGKNDCWGSDLVAHAAKGDIAGVSSARFWHGAKINMHIHRQIWYAQEVMGGGGEG
ncbi:hypothetical protein [Mesorhizobium sp. 1M-11]|uniref:beta family protein n=1 Tax=Mesorhizobium sp. 1M-11 TaxID=1529006 RepID=UPI0006C7482C|nr:hypothetical protein [Mesorhizobium sp. 1M-11]